MYPEQVLQFWFEEIESKKWWVKDTDFDLMVRSRFENLHMAANRCELFSWRKTAWGRVAEIIVLDQFSRNMFRENPKSFLSDPMALCLAQEAVALGVHEQLEPQAGQFLLMPFMHSESGLIHEEAVKLFDRPDMESNYKFELKHKAIINRFGRYPHRNTILGRQSSPEELEFLKEPGSRF